MRSELNIKKLFSRYCNDEGLVNDISKYAFEKNNLTLFELEEILNFIYSETNLDIRIFRERPVVLKRRSVILENDLKELSKIKDILKSEDVNRRLYIDNGLDVSKYINNKYIMDAKWAIKKAGNVIKFILEDKDLDNNILQAAPKIVARKSLDEIKNIVDYIKKDSVLDINIINIRPTILFKCSVDKMEAVKRVFISKGIDLDYLNSHPEVFCSNSSSEDLLKMIELFENTPGIHLNLLLDNSILFERGNVIVIEKLIHYFKNLEGFGFEYINKHPRVLLANNYDMVVNRFKKILNHKKVDNRFLYNNPYFIYSNNFKDIDNYVTYFEDSKFLSLDDLVEERSIIAKRSLEEIKKSIIFINGILKIKNKSNIKEILSKRSLHDIEQIVDFIEKKTGLGISFITNHPKVLSQKSPEVLKRTYGILKRLNISDDDIKKCVTVLTYGKVSELENLYKVITDTSEINNNILSNCLTVLAKGEVNKLISVINYFKNESELGVDVLNKCPSLLVKTTVENIRNIESYFKSDKNHSLYELRECPSILMGTNLDNIIDVTSVLEELGMLSLLSGKIYTIKAVNIRKIYDICAKFNIINELKNTPVILRENPELFYARVCYFKDCNIDITVTKEKNKRDIINRKLICSRKKFESIYGITTEELIEKYPYDKKVLVK